MEAVTCRRPGDTRGMCLGSSRIRGAAAQEMQRGWGSTECCHGKAGLPWENGDGKGQKEPAWKCALIHHNIPSGFSSRRKGPEVSAQS